MTKRLMRVLEEEKSAYKNTKYGFKNLSKSAKASEATADEVLSELQNLRETMTEAFNLRATREWADAETRTDLIVDGQTLVEDVPVRLLVNFEKQLKRMRKVFWYLDDLPDNPQLQAMSERVDRLYSAVQAARQEANLSHVDEVDIAQPVVDYIFEE